MPTITQLEYIIAVDIKRHFGLAAQMCFVTQPTLSAQIKKAEESLGVMIFDRSKQPILPTAVGIEVIKQARIVLRENQSLGQLVADFQNDVSGQLRIGIIPTIAPYLLPFFVGDFIRKYPKINLQVKEITTEEIIRDLKNDVLDAGILVTPLHEKEIKEHPVFFEEIQLYVHPEHRFSQKETVPSSELSPEDIWMLSQGHCFRNQVINLCSTELSTPNRKLPFKYESGSLEGLQRLVDKEGGFTLVPELAMMNIDGKQKIKSSKNVRSIDAPIPLREISIVYIRNYAKIKLLELLEQEIKNTIPKYMLNKDRGQVVEWI